MAGDRLDVAKKQHRERGQLNHRKRLGLLEKHGDYVKRAKDFHSKEDRIKKLRQKAAARNKDEFYFGMIRSRTEGGVHIQDRGNEPMPVDVVKLLKTQDAGYVRTLLSTEEKLIERIRVSLGSIIAMQPEEAAGNLKENSDIEASDDSDMGQGTSKQAILNLLNAADGQGKKTVFVDSVKAVFDYKPKEYKKVPEQLVKAQKNVSRRNGTGKGKGPARAEHDEAALAEKKGVRSSHLQGLASELSARLERLALLQRTYQEMQVQRALMGKGSKNVIGTRVGALSREEQRLNTGDMDELELKQLGSRKRKLPEPEKGIRTGARVWKWKTERRR